MIQSLPATTWPSLLCDVAAAGGEAAADRLATAFGGRVIYIPRKPTPRLTSVVGLEAAAWLCRTYAGEYIRVPMGPRRRDVQNARRIQNLSDQGLSARTIAETVGVSERTVHRVRARCRSVGS